MQTKDKARVIWDCFGFSFPRSVIGPENLSLSNQMETKTNQNLVTCVFPRFKEFACFYSEFSFDPFDFFLCSYWLF